MQLYTNDSNIPLALAVWLANDEYAHNPDPFTISATSLLKPVKQLAFSFLAKSVDNPEIALQTLSSRMASRVGQAIHASLEDAWKNNYERSMKALGYPDKVISQLRINPSESELKAHAIAGKEIIPVYVEGRMQRKVNRWTITGQYDLIVDGRVTDLKTTKTFGYISGSNDDAYIKQGSIYKWLNPTKITDDQLSILYYFKDWTAMAARANPLYPKAEMLQKMFPLMSIQETERFVTNKLRQLDAAIGKPEEEIPECTSKELWEDPTKYKYYSNPYKLAKATKNFDDSYEAAMFMASKGGIGVVLEVPGKVKACNYCDFSTICKQRAALAEAGRL
jgi:hypothetical protein